MIILKILRHLRKRLYKGQEDKINMWKFAKLSTGTGCPGRWPCVGGDVGPDDFQRSVPTSAILWNSLTHAYANSERIKQNRAILDVKVVCRLCVGSPKKHLFLPLLETKYCVSRKFPIWPHEKHGTYAKLISRYLDCKDHNSETNDYWYISSIEQKCSKFSVTVSQSVT